MSEVYIVPRDRAGMELDEFLCLLFPEWNKGFLRRMVREGKVLVDGEQVLPSRRLRADQVLMVDIDPDAAPAAPIAPGIELEILHETDGWLVIQKPAGLAVEPERWARERASMSGAMLQVARSRAGDDATEIDERLRIVHRLDKETSGALLVAKDLDAERALRTAFEEGRVAKAYLALVEGEHPLPDGEVETIDVPLGPDARRSGRMRVMPRKVGRNGEAPRRSKRKAAGKPSRTRIRVEQRFRGFTLLRCEPLTGRTHQIRVHLADAGFPLAVDKVYGRRDALLLSELKSSYRAKRGRAEHPLIDRLTLHAAEIGVPDVRGRSEELVRVTAPLPKDFARALMQLEKHRSLSR